MWEGARNGWKRENDKDKDKKENTENNILTTTKGACENALTNSWGRTAIGISLSFCTATATTPAPPPREFLFLLVLLLLVVVVVVGVCIFRGKIHSRVRSTCVAGASGPAPGEVAGTCVDQFIS